MQNQLTRIAFITFLSTALAGGAAGTAFASPASTAVPSASALSQANATSGPLIEAVVPGDRTTGYPSLACTPANDGEEVTTLVTTLGPPSIATFINWRCQGDTGKWVKI